MTEEEIKKALNSSHKKTRHQAITEGLNSLNLQIRDNAIIKALRYGDEKLENQAKKALIKIFLSKEFYERIRKIIIWYFKVINQKEIHNIFFNAVSIAFIRIYEKSEDSRFEVLNLTAYIIVIIKNHFLTQIRENKKHVRKSRYDDINIQAELDRKVLERFYIENSDYNEKAFSAAWQKLNKDEKELLELRFLDGIKVINLPKKPGETLAAIRQRLYRTKVKFQKFYKDALDIKLKNR